MHMFGEKKVRFHGLLILLDWLIQMCRLLWTHISPPSSFCRRRVSSSDASLPPSFCRWQISPTQVIEVFESPEVPQSLEVFVERWQTVNHWMLNTFVEICHIETSLFHLSISEIFITIDDVSINILKDELHYLRG